MTTMGNGPPLKGDGRTTALDPDVARRPPSFVDDYAEAVIAAAKLSHNTGLDTWTQNGSGGALEPNLTIERLLEAQRKLAAIPPLWVEDPFVPLDRVESDGSRKPVLCWKVGDTFRVHPERMPKFRELLDGLAPFGPKEK